MRTLKELEQEMKSKKAYLTEKYLGEILPLILPEGNWVHNERFLKYKPDYRNDKLKLIVEFDGADHYQNAPVVIRDLKKDKVYEEAGYKVVRIPYFVQLNTQTIKMFFGIDVEFDYGYPQGFISSQVVLPASYCEIGIERFMGDLCKYKEIEDEIVKSLEDKVDKLGYALVLPDSIRAVYFKEYSNKAKHHEEIGTFYLEQTLRSNWNITMTVLYNLLEGQLGTHNFLPILDTDDGVIVGLKWMYRVLNNIADCELRVQVLNEEQVMLSVRIGERKLETVMSANSDVEDLFEITLSLM